VGLKTSKMRDETTTMRMPEMNILVAVDFSDASEQILQKAKALALVLSAKVYLLHIAEPKPGFLGYAGSYVDYGSGYVDYGPDPTLMRKQIAAKLHGEHKRLQKEAAAFREAGVNTVALLIQGEIISAILSEAEKLASEMVVVGSHGHGAILDLLVGSVSKGVLKSAPCPVLVIPTQGQASKKT